MAGPWEKYGKSGVVASMPGAGPKPPTGYGAPGAPPVVPLQGGPDDPATVARLESLKAGIGANKEMGVAKYRTKLELHADAIRREREQKQTKALDPQKLANIRAAQGQLDRLQYLYNKGPGRTKGLAGVFDLVPSQENAQFDTAGAGLGEIGLAAFRTPGVGSQSDAELRAFIDANRPSAKDFDTRITEKLSNLQNRINQSYQVYGLKRPPAKKYGDEPRVIDFNSLPD